MVMPPAGTPRPYGVKNGKWAPAPGAPVTGHSTLTCKLCRRTIHALEDARREGKPVACGPYRWQEQVTKMRPPLERWKVIVQLGQVQEYMHKMVMTEEEVAARIVLLNIELNKNNLPFQQLKAAKADAIKKMLMKRES